MKAERPGASDTLLDELEHGTPLEETTICYQHPFILPLVTSFLLGLPPTLPLVSTALPFLRETVNLP